MIWFDIVHVDIYSYFFMFNHHNHVNRADNKNGDTKDLNISYNLNIYKNMLSI